MQKSRRQLQWSVTVRRFHKRKSCCHVIAIPQAGISAPTLTVMQGFEAKEKDCSLHFLSLSCVYTSYTSIPRVRNPCANWTRVRWLEAEMESSRTSLASRTHFEVLGLGLEDSTIFWIVKILWSAWKIFWKTFFCEDRLKNFCEDLFFFWIALALVSLVLEHSCPWPRECLSSERLSLASDVFLCPWPWPRALCSRLHLWLEGKCST